MKITWILQSEVGCWGIAREHHFICMRNHCVLQSFLFLAPFPFIHILFQHLTLCIITITQGGHKTLPSSRRSWPGPVKTTPELLPLTQHQTLWSLLAVCKSWLRLLCRYYGREKALSVFKTKTLKAHCSYTNLTLYKYTKINHWLVSVW